jgi:hypothetical protein
LFSLLLLSALPAAAQEAPEATATEEPTVEATPIACDNPDELEVITTEGLASDITTPAFDGSGTEEKEFLVDLGATSLDATAPVDIAMTWDLAVNDYDLGADSAASSGFSENYQPFDPTEENVRLDVVNHCEVIYVRAVNFLAPVDLDEIALAFTVGPVVTPAAE